MRPGGIFDQKTKKLIIPLYLWNIFYVIVLYTFKRFGLFSHYAINLYTSTVSPITDGFHFFFNMSGWFVVPLYMLQIFNFLIRRLVTTITRNRFEVHELGYFTTYLALGLLSIYLSLHGFRTGWWLVLNRALYFLPFYALGTLYQKYEKYDRLDSACYFTIVLVIALSILCYYDYMPTIKYRAVDFSSCASCPLLAIIVGVISIAFWLRVAKILTPALSDSWCIRAIADNTYAIMLHRLLGFWLVGMIFMLLNAYGFCQDFSLQNYKADPYTAYVPRNLTQFRLLYVIGGITLSLALQYLTIKLTRASLDLVRVMREKILMIVR